MGQRDVPRGVMALRYFPKSLDDRGEFGIMEESSEVAINVDGILGSHGSGVFQHDASSTTSLLWIVFEKAHSFIELKLK